MPRKVKVSGQWRDVKTHYRMIGGKWRQIAFRYVKVNGAWRQVFAAQYPVGLYELNTDNLVGSYNLVFRDGQYYAEINGYCADPNRPIMVGFRFHNVPDDASFNFNFQAVASTVNANVQFWERGSLQNSFNGGSGGTSLFHAGNPVDIVYRISATADTGPVSASLLLSGVTINGTQV